MGDIYCRCGEGWSFRGLHYTSSDLPWWRARDLIRGAGCPTCEGHFPVDPARDERWRASVERESEGEIFDHQPWGLAPYRPGDFEESVVVTGQVGYTSQQDPNFREPPRTVRARYLDHQPGELWAVIHDHFVEYRVDAPDARCRQRARLKAWRQEVEGVLGSGWELDDRHEDLFRNETCLLIGHYTCPSSVPRNKALTWKGWYDTVHVDFLGEAAVQDIQRLVDRLADPKAEPDEELYNEAYEAFHQEAREDAQQTVQDEVDRQLTEATGVRYVSIVIPDMDDVSSEDCSGFPEFDGEKFDEWLPTVFQPIGWSFHRSILNDQFFLAVPAGLLQDSEGWTATELFGLAVHSTDPIFEWGRYRLEEFLDPTRSTGPRYSLSVPSVKWSEIPLHTRVQFLAYLKDN